jgi:hypothetical protein
MNDVRVITYVKWSERKFGQDIAWRALHLNRTLQRIALNIYKTIKNENVEGK